MIVAMARIDPISGSGRKPQAHGFMASLFRDKPLGAAGALMFAVFLVSGALADFITPYDVNETNMLRHLEPPSANFWLGTDHIGRDVLSRIIKGAQISMTVGFASAIIATGVSILLGMVSYLSPKLDMLVQRFVDAWMTFPDLVLVMVIIAIVGSGMAQVIVVLGLLYGISGSRIVRGAVFSIRENTYIHASRAMGGSSIHVILLHILPNILPVIIVLFTTRVGAAILTEAGLSFLGLGVPPPAPSWGGMLSDIGRSYMYSAPWLAIAPGVCLTLVVYSINVFGDALRDLLDPYMRGLR